MFRKFFSAALAVAAVSSFHFQQASAGPVTKVSNPMVSWMDDGSGNPLSSSVSLLSGVRIPSGMNVSNAYRAGLDDAGNAYLAYVEYVGDFADDDSYAVKVSKFTPTLQRVAFSNGQNELTLDTFSYPSDGSNTNYPNAKVEIRVEPSGTFAVGWHSWSVVQNSYVAKFQSFAASGNSLTAVLGNHLGTFVSLDFAQMDVGSYVFTATNAGSSQAWVSEFFSRGDVSRIKTMVAVDNGTSKSQPFSCNAVSGDYCTEVVSTNGQRLSFVSGTSATSPVGAVPEPYFKSTHFNIYGGCGASSLNNWGFGRTWMERGSSEQSYSYRKVFIGKRPVSKQVNAYEWRHPSCFAVSSLETRVRFVSGMVAYPDVNVVGDYVGASIGDIYPQEGGGIISVVIQNGSNRSVYYYTGFDERYRVPQVKEIASVPFSGEANFKVTANRQGVVLFY